MITAHSGSDGFKDNSMAFIEAMLNANVEAFEIDCQLAEDGTLYLSHDEMADYADCVLLKDVFQRMTTSQNQTTLINIDCKNGAIGPLAVELAQTFDLVDRIVLSGGLVIEDYEPSFRPQLFYNFENSWDYSQTFDHEVFVRVLSDIYARGVRVVQFYYGFVTPEIVEIIHHFNVNISVWTVNDLSTIDIYLNMGVYNVTSRSALAYLGVA